jgi:cation:H+ antiporter
MINGILGRFNGIGLLICFSIFIYDMIQQTKNYQEQEEIIVNKPLWKVIIFGLFGLGAIIYGGNLVVDNASLIAIQLGMSEKLVGLTIVALGTSLPEFMTSIIATKKGEVEMAIGNVLGSNIFNILLVLGLSSLISPMTATASIIDAAFLFVITLLFTLIIYKKKTVDKIIGIPMVALYIIYVILTIF